MKRNHFRDFLALCLLAAPNASRSCRWAALAFVASLAFVAHPAQADAVTEAWVQRCTGPGNNYDVADAVAVDASGSVFVTGSSTGGDNSADFATIKYSSAGVPLWTNRYNSGLNDYAIAVAVDGAGNVVVAGMFATIKYLADGTGSWTNTAALNGGNLQAMALDRDGNVVVAGYSRNGTSDDCYTAKYAAADGALLWEKQYNGPGNGLDRFYAIAVDASNNVVVTGNSGVWPNNDFYTAKYAAADGALLWEKSYNGPGNYFDRGNAVAVDGSGNVVVAGVSYDATGDYYIAKYAATDGALLWEQRYNSEGNGYDEAGAVAVDGSGNVFVVGESATVAYSSAGTPLWTNRYNGPDNSLDSATAVAVDGSGNVIVTGYSVIGPSADYATIAYSNAGVPLWTNRYNGPDNSRDSATAVAVDGRGNVIVTGLSYGSGSSDDYATIKYSSLGMPLWTNRYNGPGYFQAAANAVVVETSGNVVVTGSSGGFDSSAYATIKYSGAGVPIWTNGYGGGGMAARAVALDGSGNVIVTGGSGFSSSDYVTIKYSSAGVPLWTMRYNGPWNFTDSASAIAVDGSGNVLVTGSSSGNGSSYDYATIKYSSAGVLLWTMRYNGPGNGIDSANAIAVDDGGDVCVTGSSAGSSSSGDFATIKYSSAGVPLWTNRYNGPGNGNDSASAVVVDRSNNVYVTGSSMGSGSTSDYATIKYSSAGVPLWTNRYNGAGNGYDSASAVVVDGSRNVIVTGSSAGNGGNLDYATIVYSSAGMPLWTNRYNGPANGNDSASAVVVDGSGNVIVTGNSSGIGTSTDYATVAYSSTGVPLWTIRYNGPGNGNDSTKGKQSLALGLDGSVYVTGASVGASGGTEFATVKYTVSPLPPLLMIQMITPDSVRLCWTTNAANYVLEFKDQLSTNVSWTPVSTPVAIEGSNFCITNRTDSSNARFYRLRLDNGM